MTELPAQEFQPVTIRPIVGPSWLKIFSAVLAAMIAFAVLAALIVVLTLGAIVAKVSGQDDPTSAYAGLSVECQAAIDDGSGADADACKYDDLDQINAYRGTK